jgi:hypothetical protein
MNWLITLKKGLLGVATFAVAYAAINPQIVLKFVPDQIENMTVGALVAGALVALSNWLKNAGKK